MTKCREGSRGVVVQMQVQHYQYPKSYSEATAVGAHVASAGSFARAHYPSGTTTNFRQRAYALDDGFVGGASLPMNYP
jgi:hypothetical protein